MDHPIKNDHSRFRKIVKGKLRENLKNFVSKGQQIIPKGKNKFTIPMPSIEIPRFKFGSKSQGGTGQGDGQQGEPVQGKGDQKAKGKPEKAGQDEGSKELEVDVSLEELASILSEELELPNIEPKGSAQIESCKNRYTSIGTTGPDSLKHHKRTFRQSLKRQISIGAYDPDRPSIIPTRKDYRFRASKTKIEKQNNAVVIYMMDVSGSMGDEQKEIVRTESFWINLWLKHQYKEIDIRYIIHDASAKEVEEEVFFSTRESGGTLISSAYKLCSEIIKEDYPESDWNIYPFHFSDGDNWSSDDTKLCLDILNTQILPVSNMFGYGQVESRYGSGQFFKDLHGAYSDKTQKVVLSKIKDREAILPSIKDFLGKGN